MMPIDPNNLPAGFRRAMLRDPALRQATSSPQAMERYLKVFNRDIKSQVPELSIAMPSETPIPSTTLPASASEAGKRVDMLRLDKKTGKWVDAAKKPRRAKEPNRTEREYESILKAQFPVSQIRWEAYTLRLAARCAYTPDYAVIHADGRVDLHEVKGAFIFSKALVKPRLAAVQFPQHRFFLAQKKKSGWEITELSSK